MHRRLGRLLFGGLVLWLSYSLLSQPVMAQNGTLAPVIRHQFFTAAGAVCSGCLLNAYQAGTTTRLDTYSNVTLTTTNANPIVLDSAGRATIYLSNNSYRFILTDADSVQIWDADNVSAIPANSANLDITGTAGEALTANAVVYLSDGSGALTAGRWYLADADNTYESSTASQIGVATAAIASAATGTIRLSGRVTGLSALTAGEDYYVSRTEGAIVTTPPTSQNVRFVGRADSTTTLIVDSNNPGAVRLPDSDGTHSLVLLNTSNLTTDRLVSLSFGDTNVTFDQVVSTTSAVIFTTVDTGQGANELYDMDQNVLTTSAVTFATIDTGQGPNEVNDPVFQRPQGRCTLTSGTPITTADVTAATTLYYTPYTGNNIWLYDGSAQWVQLTFSELSLAVPATTNTMYDMFVDYTAGTPALEAVAWSSDTARATALATQNSTYVQTADTDSLYVCSFRTTGVSGQTEDSFAKRYVWNYYNRVPRIGRVMESTDSWPYSNATLRQANGAAGNQLDFVIGVAEVGLTLTAVGIAGNDTAGGGTNVVTTIGEDSTTTGMTGVLGRFFFTAVANRRGTAIATILHYPAIGRHFYAWLEASDAGGTTTFYGDSGGTNMQAGIHGWIEG